MLFAPTLRARGRQLGERQVLRVDGAFLVHEVEHFSAESLHAGSLSRHAQLLTSSIYSAGCKHRRSCCTCLMMTLFRSPKDFSLFTSGIVNDLARVPRVRVFCDPHAKPFSRCGHATDGRKVDRKSAPRPHRSQAAGRRADVLVSEVIIGLSLPILFFRRETVGCGLGAQARTRVGFTCQTLTSAPASWRGGGGWASGGRAVSLPLYNCRLPAR